MNRTIVVGIDGSQTARSALVWAAEDALRRNRPLRIVHAREPWSAEHPLTASGDQETLTERCQALLADAAERAAALAPGVRISTALLTGAVIERLKTESERADTLVVGSRGLGGFAGLVLGSVVLGLAGHAECPLVVVRLLTHEGNGEIVVGHDGSPNADLALEYAMEQAAARQARVRVLHASRYPIRAPHPAGSGPSPAGEAVELGPRLMPWREKYPDIQVIETTVHGHPVPALAQASKAADLVVVGSRGLGGFASAALGSVSHGVLHRARCPVAVTSTPGRRA
ncbi:universal stress protein [Nonomuraea sp. G32]|nr:universal stress protein [Nonomuraea sp. G32]MDP4510073.1 universal stress protein [Nonomuraea sp. G32]